MILNNFIGYTRNLLCLIGLICITPFLLIACFIIVIEDGMPVFFYQERLGKNKIVFNIIKLRTLKTNAPNAGTHTLDKSYQLKSGKLIRKIKLDEFPQLINVLKGEISLIGPRPGLISQTELMHARHESNIYDIKPGITGLAQIMGYDMSNPAKLAQIDNLYLNERSFWLNLIILAGTFFTFPKKYLSKKFNIELL
jgi:O-antigen biosynthesis protein WbqP